MRIYLSTLLVIFLCLSLGEAAMDPGQSPQYESDDLTLIIKEFKASTEIKYEATTPGRSYEVEFEARVKVPEDQDVICIAEQVEAVKSVDLEDRNLIDYEEQRKRNRRSGEDYDAVQDGEAETQLKRMELTGNPSTVKEMTVRLKTVVAQERETVTIPAEVKEDLTAVGHGIRARLSAMRIDTKRVLSIQIDYDRPKGEGGAFVEAVYALDRDDRELGGGRWDKGSDIFAESIIYKGKFALQEGAQVDKFKLVIATKYNVKQVDFVVDEIFQN